MDGGGAKATVLSRTVSVIRAPSDAWNNSCIKCDNNKIKNINTFNWCLISNATYPK
jgi:hypothetical protein